MLGLVVLINRSGAMFFFFAAIYLSQQLYFSVQQAGFALGFYGFGCMIGSYLGGLSSAKIGAFLTQLISLLSTALIFIVIPCVHRYEPLVILMLLAGVGVQSFRPANDHAVALLVEDYARVNAFSLTRQATSIGTSLGPALGGILAHYSFNYLFALNAGTCFVAAMLLLAMYRSLKETPEQQPSALTHDSAVSCYKNIRFIGFLIAVFLIGLVFFQLLTTIPLFIQYAYGAGSKDFGFLLAFNGVLIIIMEVYLVEYLKKRYSSYQAIACGVLLLGISYFILIFIHQWILVYAAITIFTIGEMLVLPFIATTVKQIVGAKQAGQGYGLRALAWSASMLSAPIVGTWLIAYAGYTVLWTAALLLSIGVAMGTLCLGGK